MQRPMRSRWLSQSPSWRVPALAANLVVLPYAPLYLRRHEIPGNLVSNQNESNGHQARVRCKRLPQETALGSPDTESDQYGRQRQYLADFDSDIKRNDVCD